MNYVIVENNPFMKNKQAKLLECHLIEEMGFFIGRTKKKEAVFCQMNS
jgi:hypothetical protein